MALNTVSTEISGDLGLGTFAAACPSPGMFIVVKMQD